MANLGQKMVAKFANDNANFLFITAAVGWFLASAAQTFGIVTNKKIDKDDKKFLIPQEIFDGAVNIGLYALITTPLINGTEKLINNDVITFKNIKKDSIEFDRLRGGAKVLASLVGAVVSCNVLTPLVRNKLGSIAQRKELKQKVQMQQPSYDPYYQPFFQKNTLRTPLKMNDYITFTKQRGLKI